MTKTRVPVRDGVVRRTAKGENTVTTGLLLIGLLLPVLLVAAVVGPGRIEEDLNEVAPRRHPHRPAREEREES
ncbi:hypothetical protein GCM10023320_09210 [Pseudonocardia adelaidensis]|uniref:Uncharacterized protein n=1 Tax=Pseudonocardia adelaidensis TaxID=648754 RepID=A0ABP9NGC7_9PSEU